MFTFVFDVVGEKQFARAFSRFGDQIKDFRPLWDKIVGSFRRIEAEQFGSEGGTGSGGWRPLSPQYAAWKAQHYPGAPILVRKGALKASLVGITGYTIDRRTPDSLLIGTSIPYALYHQKGTGRMPARKPIELSMANRDEWTKMTHRFLVDVAKAEGLL